ncbi:MAG: hypothetical protein GF334_03760 [Candidatus Altiarchaeales archaeon]|nr:hypothetical protein [Candidatus Altiarchaeales archaeon]
MVPYNSFAAKFGIINHLAVSSKCAESGIFRILLEAMTAQELQTLKDDEELVTEVTTIAEMSEKDILSYLENNFNFEPVATATGQIWLGTEEIKEYIPDWLDEACNKKYPMYGWYMPRERLKAWARKFMLQEVRVCLWEKIFQDLSEKKIQAERNKQATADTGYLWGGDYV